MKTRKIWVLVIVAVMTLPSVGALRDPRAQTIYRGKHARRQT
jgi:hypothetical protein